MRAVPGVASGGGAIHACARGVAADHHAGGDCHAILIDGRKIFDRADGDRGQLAGGDHDRLARGLYADKHLLLRLHADLKMVLGADGHAN